MDGALGGVRAKVVQILIQLSSEALAYLLTDSRQPGNFFNTWQSVSDSINGDTSSTDQQVVELRLPFAFRLFFPCKKQIRGMRTLWFCQDLFLVGRKTGLRNVQKS